MTRIPPILKLQFKKIRQALKLQAKEYERRLHDLNGEAARLRGIQQEYIPREVYDAKVKELEQNIELLNAYKIKQEGKSDLLKYIPWILTAVSIVLMYTRK